MRGGAYWPRFRIFIFYQLKPEHPYSPPNFLEAAAQ